MVSKYWTEMKDVAEKLRQDHENIRAGLAQAMQERGPVAVAARRLSELCLPHFELEERIILPMLARLNKLASAEEEREDIAQLRAQTAELSRWQMQFASEHRSVADALNSLRDAAREHGSSETIKLTEFVRNHEAFEDHLDLEGWKATD